jgi:protease I
MLLRMATALLIIAQSGFQDLELEGARRALRAAGFDVVLGSSEAGACRGKYGGTEEATVALGDVRVADYDRIAFIGGPGAAAFARDAVALRMVREVVSAGKPLGAICIAPLILAAAGVLHGKQATVWDDGVGTQIRQLEEAGARFVDAPVVRDGWLVTGNGPVAAEEFGRVLGAIEPEMPL